jgi:hypothetical protein
VPSRKSAGPSTAIASPAVTWRVPATRTTMTSAATSVTTPTPNCAGYRRPRGTNASTSTPTVAPPKRMSIGASAT